MPTNIQGGDPSVVQVSANKYLMVYVGKHLSTGGSEPPNLPITVFPNPADDAIQLMSDTALDNFDYAIYNPEGRLMLAARSEGRLISVQQLVRGLYFLKICTENGRWEVFRFLKN